jgi:hypothetical protein
VELDVLPSTRSTSSVQKVYKISPKKGLHIANKFFTIARILVHLKLFKRAPKIGNLLGQHSMKFIIGKLQYQIELKDHLGSYLRKQKMSCITSYFFRLF